MPFEDAPDIKDYPDGMPDAPPEERDLRPLVRIAIVALGVLVLGLLYANFRETQAMANLRGTGRVAGRVVDESGDPLRAEVFVFDTTLTTRADEDGWFVVGGVPAGRQSIVIAHAGAGREYEVTVEPGQIADMGTLRFGSTQPPTAP